MYSIKGSAGDNLTRKASPLLQSSNHFYFILAWSNCNTCRIIHKMAALVSSFLHKNVNGNSIKYLGREADWSGWAAEVPKGLTQLVWSVEDALHVKWTTYCISVCKMCPYLILQMPYFLLTSEEVQRCFTFYKVLLQHLSGQYTILCTAFHLKSSFQLTISTDQTQCPWIISAC